VKVYPVARKIFFLFLLFLGGALALVFLFTLYFENQFPAKVKEHFSHNSDQVLQEFTTGVALSRHFPFFALRVRDFAVLDTTGGTEFPVLRVEKADVHLNFAAMFRGKFGIRRTTLSGVTYQQRVDSLGRKINLRFKKQDQAEASSGQAAAFEISDIEVRQAAILIENQYKGSASSIVVSRALLSASFAEDTLSIEGRLHGSTRYITTRKRVLFRGEAFTARLQYAYALASQTGFVSNTVVEINQLPIQVEGTHSKVADQSGTELNLLLKGAQPLREVLHDLVPDTLRPFFAQAEGAGTVDFSYAVSGTSSPTVSPRSRISFSLRNGELRWPRRQAKLGGIALTGELDNGEAHTPATSTLTITRLSASTGTGEITGNLRMHNFLQPNVSGLLTCDSGLRELAGVLDLPNYDTYSGRLKLDVRTEGAKGREARRHSEQPLAWNGSLQMRDGAFRPQNATVLYANLNADAVFGEQAVHVRHLAGKIDGHSFTMQGSAHNLLPYVFGVAQTLQVDGAIRAKLFDLAWVSERKQPRKQGGGFLKNKLLAATSGALAVHVQQVRLTPQDDLTDLRINLRKHKNQVELKEIRFRAPMGGEGRGNGGMTLAAGKVKAPFLNMDLQFRQLDLQNLMQVLASLGTTTQKIAGAGPAASIGPDSPLADFRVRLSVAAEQLLYQKLSGTALSLLASLTQERARIERFNLRAFGGRFTSTGTMDMMAKVGYPVQLNAQLEDMNLYRMFHVADQLGLDVLRSYNIRGNIDCALDIRTRLDQSFLPNVPNTTAFAKAVIRELELIEVEPIQKALHFLREKRTRHIHFEDVHTQFVLHQGRFITPGTNLTNNISYFYLSGSYTMEQSSDLYVEVSLLDVLFGNNDRRIRRIKADPTPTQEKQGKQHLFLHREQGKYQVKLSQRKDSDVAKQQLRKEFKRLLLDHRIDTTLHLLSDERRRAGKAYVQSP
jgi:hypothetical protein